MMSEGGGSVFLTILFCIIIDVLEEWWVKEGGSKVIMQGKLIAVAYTLRTYWNQFSVGGICKQE